MIVNFGQLKVSISSRYSELKGCGANAPGGGGFRAGNTCSKGVGVGNGVQSSSSLEGVVGGTYKEMFGVDFPSAWKIQAQDLSKERFNGRTDGKNKTLILDVNKSTARVLVHELVHVRDMSTGRLTHDPHDRKFFNQLSKHNQRFFGPKKINKFGNPTLENEKKMHILLKDLIREN